MSKLCIEAGKYYRTRDGQKVGPMLAYKGYTPGLWVNGRGGLWRGDGSPFYSGSEYSPWIIAECFAAPDLTKITTPFGLLDVKTQEALRAHGGPWEVYGASSKWSDRTAPDWIDYLVYRVKPAPPKPRERWAYGDHMRDTLEEAEAFRAAVDRQNPGNGYLNTPITHWIEVLA